MKRLTKFGIRVHLLNIVLFMINMILLNKFIGLFTSINLYFILHSIVAIYSTYTLIKYSNYFDIK